MSKSRLTVQDFKHKGPCEDIVHCPTPSMATNSAFDAFMVLKGYNMRAFDVVSAFPRAEEQNEIICVNCISDKQATITT